MHEKPRKGSYMLVMKLDEDTRIPIGKRPPVEFPAGFYCYVGSAMNSLEKRICRHTSAAKKKHWHVDWFLDHARIVDVKRCESNKRLECSISDDVARIADDTPVKGFGSSDCVACYAHLHRFGEDPKELLEKMVERWKDSGRNTEGKKKP